MKTMNLPMETDGVEVNDCFAKPVMTSSLLSPQPKVIQLTVKRNQKIL